MPFTFLSGYLPQFNTNAVGTMGDVDFLSKPYEESALLDLVDRQLERLNLGTQKKVTSLVPNERTRMLKILIVDDVKDNSDLVQVYLKKFPYVLEFASTGQEALDKFSSTKFDLILMDIQMPGMDGHEATRRIRKMEADKNLGRTVIISLSAHALSEEMQNSINAGADAYLTKPITKVRLLETIDKYSNPAGNSETEQKSA